MDKFVYMVQAFGTNTKTGRPERKLVKISVPTNDYWAATLYSISKEEGMLTRFIRIIAKSMRLPFFCESASEAPERINRNDYDGALVEVAETEVMAFLVSGARLMHRNFRAEELKARFSDRCNETDCDDCDDDEYECDICECGKCCGCCCNESADEDDSDDEDDDDDEDEDEMPNVGFEVDENNKLVSFFLYASMDDMSSESREDMQVRLNEMGRAAARVYLDPKFMDKSGQIRPATAKKGKTVTYGDAEDEEPIVKIDVDNTGNVTAFFMSFDKEKQKVDDITCKLAKKLAKLFIGVDVPFRV